MTKPMVRIYQGDGDFTDREMNDEEFAQYEIDQQEHLDRRAAQKAEAEAKLQAKTALLDRLGITAEEASLLLS